MHLLTVHVLELCDVRQPFLVRTVGEKLPVQDVLCGVFRMPCCARAAVMSALDARLNAKLTHDT